MSSSGARIHGDLNGIPGFTGVLDWSGCSWIYIHGIPGLTELAFEFLVTQLLARGRVLRGSATPVYITLSADGGDKISFAIGPGAPIPLPLYFDWRAYSRRIAASESPGPRAPTFLDAVFGSRAPLRRIAIPELLTWR
ncbi:Protein of unknown function [Cotesia congregata]|uniref:Uncharacterized protein n=1 Tax=Cotesia congregata TaxID=51543 RepID=A0A8J2MN75_COTCN|nr:Protein of unknown function [Cotesia congregata]